MNSNQIKKNSINLFIKHIKKRHNINAKPNNYIDIMTHKVWMTVERHLLMSNGDRKAKLHLKNEHLNVQLVDSFNLYES